MKFLPSGIVLLISLLLPPAPASGTSGPITTPISAVRFYQRSVNRGLCAQAYKLVSLGGRGPSMRAFLARCAATKHLSVEVRDRGYRLHRQNAVYTCLGVQLTTVPRSGSVRSSGGWYLLEKTPEIFWHILALDSHSVPGGRLTIPSSSACAGAIPTYTRPSSAQLIIGSAFLSNTVGWIAVSRTASYVPTGSCDHGIGVHCGTARTTIEATGDDGSHWHALLSVATGAGPPVWISLFSPRRALVAFADVRSHTTLIATSDGGHTWRDLPLPAGYSQTPHPSPSPTRLTAGSGTGAPRWAAVRCTCTAQRHSSDPLQSRRRPHLALSARGITARSGVPRSSHEGLPQRQLRSPAHHGRDRPPAGDCWLLSAENSHELGSPVRVPLHGLRLLVALRRTHSRVRANHRERRFPPRAVSQPHSLVRGFRHHDLVDVERGRHMGPYLPAPGAWPSAGLTHLHGSTPCLGRSHPGRPAGWRPGWTGPSTDNRRWEVVQVVHQGANIGGIADGHLPVGRRCSQLPPNKRDELTDGDGVRMAGNKDRGRRQRDGVGDVVAMTVWSRTRAM